MNMEEDIELRTQTHSIKVPRVYKASAGILAAHLRGDGSVKDLVYQQINKSRHPRVKAIYALVSEAARNDNILTKLFSLTQLIQNEHPLDPSLAKILASELLWGKGLSKAGDSKPVATIRKYESKLKSNLSLKDISKRPVKKAQIPRYVRINRLKASDTALILAALKSDGYEQVTYKQENVSYSEFLQLAKKLTAYQFLLDYHFSDLLAFAPGTTFFDHRMYNEGILVLQDKASCLAVEALDPPQGSCILDVCAAHARKPLQAVTKSAYLGDKRNGCNVIAVERDTKRCNTLRSLMQKFGAVDKIQIINDDFLKIDPNLYTQVEYIILDPSCSGSGILYRDNDPAEQHENDSKERLEKLASLQTKLLRHALSFPNVKKVAYSTCSIHRRENEDVAMEILNGNESVDPVKSFKLKENCLPNWETRGLSELGKVGERFIRSKPKEDLGIGFFVAVFERTAGVNELSPTSQKRTFCDEISAVKNKRKKKKLH